MSLIGAPVARPDARAKVTGAARYPADLVRAGMLHCKAVFAHRPHARIDADRHGARARVPGVVAVLTAADVPYNRYGLIDADQEVLCSERVRYAGDRVALVVAESPRSRRRAAALVDVDYTDLPVVGDALAALEPGAPLVHPERGTNVLLHQKIRNGDVERAFAEADVVLSGTFTTSWQEHAYLQPDAGDRVLRRRDARRRDRRPVAARRPPADRGDAAARRGRGRDPLREDRRGVRRPRGSLGAAADRARDVGDEAADGDRLGPRRVDRRPSQAPSVPHRDDAGARSATGRSSPSRRARSPTAARTRRPASKCSSAPRSSRKVRTAIPNVATDGIRRLHEQRPERRVPRLRLAAGALGRGVDDRAHRARARDRPGRGAAQEPLSRRRHRGDRQRAARGRERAWPVLDRCVDGGSARLRRASRASRRARCAAASGSRAASRTSAIRSVSPSSRRRPSSCRRRSESSAPSCARASPTSVRACT